MPCVEMSGSKQPVTQRHISVQRVPRPSCCWNLKTCILFKVGHNVIGSCAPVNLRQGRMSVRLFACSNSRAAERIFWKLTEFYWSMMKHKFWLKWQNTTRHFHEDPRTFIRTSEASLCEYFSSKVDKNETHVMSIFLLLLLTLQPLVGLGLFNNSTPLLSILCLHLPTSNLHPLKVFFYLVRPH